MKVVGALVGGAAAAALLVAGPAGASKAAGGACGNIRAGGAEWTVKVIGDGTCPFAVQTLKTFVKEPHKASGLIGGWSGGPKGYSCGANYGFNKAVVGGYCSKTGVSFSWTKVGA